MDRVEPLGVATNRQQPQTQGPTSGPGSRVARKGDDIAERLVDFAADVLKLLPLLRKGPGAKAIMQQLERSGPAGGADYEEARGAESIADFVHKVRLALKEVRETRYWLKVAVRSALLNVPNETDRLMNEAGELIAILTASAATARRRGA